MYFKIKNYLKNNHNQTVKLILNGWARALVTVNFVHTKKTKQWS
jgi:hypothetical protein